MVRQTHHERTAGQRGNNRKALVRFERRPMTVGRTCVAVFPDAWRNPHTTKTKKTTKIGAKPNCKTAPDSVPLNHL